MNSRNEKMRFEPITKEQNKVVQQIKEQLKSGSKNVIVLNGAYGTGKTEIVNIVKEDISNIEHIQLYKPSFEENKLLYIYKKLIFKNSEKDPGYIIYFTFLIPFLSLLIIFFDTFVWEDTVKLKNTFLSLLGFQYIQSNINLFLLLFIVFLLLFILGIMYKINRGKILYYFITINFLPKYVFQEQIDKKIKQDFEKAIIVLEDLDRIDPEDQKEIISWVEDLRHSELKFIITLNLEDNIILSQNIMKLEPVIIYNNISTKNELFNVLKNSYYYTSTDVNLLNKIYDYIYNARTIDKELSIRNIIFIIEYLNINNLSANIVDIFIDAISRLDNKYVINTNGDASSLVDEMQEKINLSENSYELENGDYSKSSVEIQILGKINNKIDKLVEQVYLLNKSIANKNFIHTPEEANLKEAFLSVASPLYIGSYDKYSYESDDFLTCLPYIKSKYYWHQRLNKNLNVENILIRFSDYIGNNKANKSNILAVIRFMQQLNFSYNTDSKIPPEIVGGLKREESIDVELSVEPLIEFQSIINRYKYIVKKNEYDITIEVNYTNKKVGTILFMRGTLESIEMNRANNDIEIISVAKRYIFKYLVGIINFNYFKDGDFLSDLQEKLKTNILYSVTNNLYNDQILDKELQKFLPCVAYNFNIENHYDIKLLNKINEYFQSLENPEILLLLEIFRESHIYKSEVNRQYNTVLNI